MEIRDKVCVVTGAASGLGRATATHLEKLGAHVAWLDLNVESIGASPDGSQRLALEVNVSEAASMENAFAEVERKLGSARILVNCAGVLGPAKVAKKGDDGKFRPRDLDLFRRVLEVNLVGTFNAIRLFTATASMLEPLFGGERGVIVNTASIAADEALSGQTAYGASKGGVAAMTLPMARELAQFGIRVMAIKPGVFETGMYEVIPEETRRALDADVPFPSRPGHPDEFAQLVEAIVINQMLNGSPIRIDGAARMREPTARTSAP